MYTSSIYTGIPLQSEETEHSCVWNLQGSNPNPSSHPVSFILIQETKARSEKKGSKENKGRPDHQDLQVYGTHSLRYSHSSWWRENILPGCLVIDGCRSDENNARNLLPLSWLCNTPELGFLVNTWHLYYPWRQLTTVVETLWDLLFKVVFFSLRLQWQKCFWLFAPHHCPRPVNMLAFPSGDSVVVQVKYSLLCYQAAVENDAVDKYHSDSRSALIAPTLAGWLCESQQNQLERNVTLEMKTVTSPVVLDETVGSLDVDCIFVISADFPPISWSRTNSRVWKKWSWQLDWQ